MGRIRFVRVRVAVFVVVALTACGCGSSKQTPVEQTSSLQELAHLTADESSFGVILDAKSGKALAAFRVNNPIRAAIPDGHGGWYIGGGFIYVDGVLRKRLAHIDRNGRLDAHWKPEANGNGVSVTSLARSGSRLYVAGDFARLQHQPRFQLGALDVRSGRLEDWRPPRRYSYSYDALVTAGRRLIVGGTSCCSEAGSSVMALDAETGALDESWRPHVDGVQLHGEGVYMLVSNGRAIVIRGLFGRTPDQVAAGEIDAASGRLARKWTPHVGHHCLWCQLMAAAVGNRRVFASVNGLPTVLAFSKQTGSLDGRWRAAISAVTGFYGGTSAYAVAIAGGRVYVAGDFDRIRRVHKNGFAALDQDDARVLPSWQPRAARLYGSLLVPSGDRLLLGITLARRLEFNYAGLKTYRPVRTLRLTLALSGPGRVRLALGRGCDVGRWESSSSLRCGGHVIRRLATIRFADAGRKHYVHRLGVPAGRYFVRFAPGGLPPQDFPIQVPPRKVRSTFRG